MFENLYKIRNIPRSIAFKKLISKLTSSFSLNRSKKEFDYVFNFPLQIQLESKGFFTILWDEFLIEKKELLQEIGSNIVEHKFNLLGTGWIDRNFECEKEEIRKQIPNFWRLTFEEIIDYLQKYEYKNINFWNDPKSSYQWDLKPSRVIKFNISNDPKQAWELGRMQHLVLFAYLFRLSNLLSDNESAEQYLGEYQNQILDFIATNPPLNGIQWKSPMDCSIRLINWLVSFDMLQSSGAVFSPFFLEHFENSVKHHILFILSNLEWSEGLRGNHYFSNIVALCFAGCFLESTEFAAQLLAFSLQELIAETLFQFQPDGSNFEASSFYHCQVLEMLLLALYAILNLPESHKKLLKEYSTKNWIGARKLKKPLSQKFNFDSENNLVFDSSFNERVRKAILFYLILKKPDGSIEQIGDNDSGRILRLNYFLDQIEYNKELFDNLLRYPVIDALINVLTDQPTYNFLDSIFPKKVKFLNKFYIEPTEKISCLAFNDFGLYAFRSKDLHFLIRCGQIGQQGKGGHSHNDQLSFTMNYKGKDFVVDTGTYCYSCSAQERNYFRSVQSHNTLAIPNQEQNIWAESNFDDLFWIKKHRTKSKVVKFNENSIVCEHYAYPKKHRRQVSFEHNAILFQDECRTDGTKFLLLHFHPNVEIIELNDDYVVTENSSVRIKIFFEQGKLVVEDYYFASQYGVKIPSKCLICSFDGDVNRWKIEFLV